ncbi:hypothetical protein [Paractinoplanes rishiriensis]|uniref:Aspartate carbamoyltransferase n=1 Tax=Paractinoplanes rishiriensis TaxID=1050105 RepID=A0A919JYQ8_9ACTN|nr:hypothetical protein [Actinoplanes rishiriensis]GIE97183.1 hypothetical protein Ari01nite_46480 [Actinoplanes rishiriensis]
MTQADRPSRGITRSRAAAVWLAVVAVALGPLAGGCTGDRQAEVAERGRSVMPFDLDRTTHRFTKNPGGGEQTVVSGEPGQIALIRQHLRQEAERFRAGDFADPAAIHGDAMPGLAALRASAGRITVTYADTPDGARITYATTDPALEQALHQWFDAQVSDHGRHATPG